MLCGQNISDLVQAHSNRVNQHQDQSERSYKVIVTKRHRHERHLGQNQLNSVERRNNRTKIAPWSQSRDPCKKIRTI